MTISKVFEPKYDLRNLLASMWGERSKELLGTGEVEEKSSAILWTFPRSYWHKESFPHHTVLWLQETCC